MKPPISRPRSKPTSIAKASRQYILGLDEGLVVDEFACGGGMSEAIEQALGRHVDHSVNHDDDACSMHQANHPQTIHHCADVFGREVAPASIEPERPIDHLHLSPDCTDHSQAKGGQPRSVKRRGLAWIGVRWAALPEWRRPKVITLENVKEVLRWGALIAKRCPKTGRVLKLDGSVAAKGERVPRREQYLIPDPARAGQTWQRFVGALRALGYTVDWWTLNAADFGTPTTRTRLFMVATCDGIAPIRPEPTHFKSPKPGQQKWRAAAECIDWSIPARSIFGRKKDLADATMQRIARGMWKFVLGPDANPFIVKFRFDSEGKAITEPLPTITAGNGARPAGAGHALGLATPMIVPVTHSDKRVHDAAQPLPVITTAKGGEFALGAATLVKFKGESPGTDPAAPLDTITAQGHGMGALVGTMVQMGYGERPGQDPRALDVEKPLGTITAGGGKFAAVSAFMMQANGGFNQTPGHAMDQPTSTISTKGAAQQPVVANLVQLRNNCDGRSAHEPLRTVSASGEHHGVVEYHLSKDHEEGALRCAAFLMRYHASGGQWADLNDPATTITTKDRLALVTVWFRGEPWVIVDICLRMLTPRELARAQGFPDDYVLEHGHDGRKFSQATQVWMIGNSVPPPLGRAVIAAQWNARAPNAEQLRKAA
jgi:DNA (cytosine-5)-methyltransferase 1